ncbi:hypothetical protein Micbo1qcDRAFT_181032 [Microdochium bolleyi]|uniref:Uncharacterized protein n=1 Tax=Microdochium bolleyi TaxID=196109 RepID=A0A136IJQ2_9PEZI|nr:hypothetical protein Micbo1qcDRAFT_181032 [Microdochium bolleyi]
MQHDGTMIPRICISPQQRPSLQIPPSSCPFSITSQRSALLDRHRRTHRQPLRSIIYNDSFYIMAPRRPSTRQAILGTLSRLPTELLAQVAEEAIAPRDGLQLEQMAGLASNQWHGANQHQQEPDDMRLASIEGLKPLASMLLDNPVTTTRFEFFNLGVVHRFLASLSPLDLSRIGHIYFGINIEYEDTPQLLQAAVAEGEVSGSHLKSLVNLHCFQIELRMCKYRDDNADWQGERPLVLGPSGTGLPPLFVSGRASSAFWTSTTIKDCLDRLHQQLEQRCQQHAGQHFLRLPTEAIKYTNVPNIPERMMMAYKESQLTVPGCYKLCPWDKRPDQPISSRTRYRRVLSKYNTTRRRRPLMIDPADGLIKDFVTITGIAYESDRLMVSTKRPGEVKNVPIAALMSNDGVEALKAHFDQGLVLHGPYSAHQVVSMIVTELCSSPMGGKGSRERLRRRLLRAAGLM